MKLKLLSCCFLLFAISCQSLSGDISSEFGQATTASFAGNIPATSAVSESATPVFV